eukprot:2180629-Alexandrium_andersonii.AAC.1
MSALGARSDRSSVHLGPRAAASFRFSWPAPLPLPMARSCACSLSFPSLASCRTLASELRSGAPVLPAVLARSMTLVAASQTFLVA